MEHELAEYGMDAVDYARILCFFAGLLFGLLICVAAGLCLAVSMPPVREEMGRRHVESSAGQGSQSPAVDAGTPGGGLPAAGHGPADISDERYQHMPDSGGT